MKYCTPSIANYSEFHYNSSQQLELFPLLKKRRKPQISSVPGIPPKARNRYRVMLGEKILGEYLTLDQALQLAKRGGK